ncbi:MAG: 4-(cytidine 5'-diphospho)-2-C-methyl-D-erythritol kinase [Dehalococcoidia bacterium]
MLTVHTPSKVNLVLEVLGKAGDYHRISSVVQSIDLCDVLSFDPDGEIRFECDEPALENDNLVTRAAVLLRRRTGCASGARIRLHKCIPWSAGLGGGSSDAAAVLLGLNELWRLGLSIRELLGLGSELGSDVPFFLHGGTALVEGRGEVVTPLPPWPPTCFVLLVPSLTRMEGKTGQMYARLTGTHFTDGRRVQECVAALRQGKAVDRTVMVNVFESVAYDLMPELDAYRKALLEAGAPAVHLAGSGPCLFASLSAREKAVELLSHLKKQGFECYLAASCSGYKILQGLPGLQTGSVDEYEDG